MKLSERVDMAWRFEALRVGSYVIARQIVMQQFKLSAARVDQLLAEAAERAAQQAKCAAGRKP
jgi:ABC-type molybdate transport system permease subunit